jgi:signal peptide peptidase SppA
MNKSILMDLSNGLWAMEPQRCADLFFRISSLPEMNHLSTVQIQAPEPAFGRRGNVAVINIVGVLMNSVPAWFKFWGIKATGYDEIISQVQAALADPSIEYIELAVNSPGGMVGGVAPAAEVIYEARKEKDVTAVVTDLAASGAYWLASQASRIETSDKNAMVGSIGVYSVYYDWTKFMSDMGVRPVVIRSGPIKGMGIDEITDEQIAAVQEMITAMADNFVDAVTAGRITDRERVVEWATGQVWIAETARDLGLIDTVYESSDSRQTESSNNAKGQEMNEEKQDEAQVAQVDTDAIQAETKAAEQNRLDAIVEACHGDKEFAFDAFKRGLSALEAKAEYADVLAEKLAEKLTVVEQVEKSDPDPDPLPTGLSDDAGGSLAFIDQAREMAEEKGITVTEAMRRIRRKNPESHAKFISEQERIGRPVYELV